MNDIIAFIERAMELNLNIRTTHNECKNIESYGIDVHKEDDSSLSILYIKEQKNPENISLSITTNYLDWVKIENISELDIANFKVIILKAERYSKNKVLDYFNNFFKEEESKLTDINDLDDKED